MKARLMLNFEDGSYEAIELDHVVEINVPTPSVEFACNKSGKWTMRITKGLTKERKLGKVFLSCHKVD